MPEWNDPTFDLYLSPVVVLGVAGAACLVGAYYASKVNEQDHRYAGCFCLMLLVLGVCLIFAALGPLWSKS